VYELETDQEAVGDLEGLPASAPVPYAEALSLLEVAPWSGQAYNRQRPDGTLRVGAPESDVVSTGRLRGPRRAGRAACVRAAPFRAGVNRGQTIWRPAPMISEPAFDLH